MKIEALNNERTADFVMYCKKHRMELDDSFLYDEDLKNFEANDENPTYIATDDQNQIIAAASLIVDNYNRRGKKGRFRIFHSEIDDTACCNMLLQSILKHTEGLDKVIVFVPVVNERLMKAIEDLKFKT